MTFLQKFWKAPPASPKVEEPPKLEDFHYIAKFFGAAPGETDMVAMTEEPMSNARRVMMAIGSQHYPLHWWCEESHLFMGITCRDARPSQFSGRVPAPFAWMDKLRAFHVHVAMTASSLGMRFELMRSVAVPTVHGKLRQVG